MLRSPSVEVGGVSQWRAMVSGTVRLSRLVGGSRVASWSIGSRVSLQTSVHCGVLGCDTKWSRSALMVTVWVKRLIFHGNYTNYWSTRSAWDETVGWSAHLSTDHPAATVTSELQVTTTTNHHQKWENQSWLTDLIVINSWVITCGCQANALVSNGTPVLKSNVGPPTNGSTNNVSFCYRWSAFMPLCLLRIFIATMV